METHATEHERPVYDVPEREPGLHGWFVLLEQIIASILVFLVLSLLVAQVYFRYVARDPLLWSDEAARISLIYLTFIGAGMVAAGDNHISMDLIENRMSVRARQLLRAFVNILMIGTSAVVVYTALPTIDRAWTQFTTALEIPFAWLYMAGAFGFALILLHGLRNTFMHLTGRSNVGLDAIEKNLI